MSNVTTYQLNTEEKIRFIADIAHAEANRAALFMAHALNASSSVSELDLRLPGFVQYLPNIENPTGEHAEHFRKDFEAWTIGNGLRDLIESTDTYLDHLFRILAPIDQQLKKGRESDTNRQTKKFARLSAAAKLEKLGERFGISTGNERYLRSLTQARNCLSHRRGHIGPEDCGSDNKFHLLWLGVDGTIRESDGTEHIITPETTGPIDAKDINKDGKSQMTVTIVERVAAFDSGQRIEISPRSLQEITFLIVHTGFKVLQLALNWLLDQGLPVNGRKPVPDPVVEQSFVMEYPDDEE